MNQTRSVSRGVLTPLVLAGALAAAAFFSATPARAHTPEYELDVFGGVHLWHPYNSIGRLDSAGGSDISSLTQFSHGGAFGVRLGLGLHKRFMLEAELAILPTLAVDEATHLLGIGYRLHGVVNILTGRVRPFLLFGGGGLALSSSDPYTIHSDNTGSVDLGAGLKIDVRSNWGVRLDGRALLVPGGGGAPALVPDGEVLFAFYGRFGALKGGVQPEPDDDKDGVPNAADLCPQVAGIKENKGCPIDGDGDGVADVQDKCPKDKGPAELKGCPSLSALDSDGDGVFDDKDKCPDAPEVVNGYSDDDGCPDIPPPAALVPFLGTVQGVAFESERSDLLPSSLPILDRAVQALRDAATAQLEIAGYTDNSGDVQRNLELSQKRADAVKAYLVGKGIAATRLTSRGYGQDNPIADNATPEGREKNRRVEFHFVN